MPTPPPPTPPPLHPNLRRAFDLLGIEPCSFTGEGAAAQLAQWKDEVLKPAWKRAAKRYHPDGEGGSEMDPVRFQEAQAAYTMLLGVQVRPPRPVRPVRPEPLEPEPELEPDIDFGGFGFGSRDPFERLRQEPRRKAKAKAKPAPARWGQQPTPEGPELTALAPIGRNGIDIAARRNADGSVEVSLRASDPEAAQQMLSALAHLLQPPPTPPSPSPPPPPEVGQRLANRLRRRMVVINGGGRGG